MGYIYKITNLINNKVYIGQTITTVEERFKRHKQLANTTDSRRLYRAMRKYGIDNFKIEALTEANESNLDELERFYIKLYNATDKVFGYNMTDGGNGCKSAIRLMPKDKQLERNHKIATALKGRTQSAELVAKRSKKLCGQKRTPEQRLKFSEAQKQRFKTQPGTRSGIKASEETKQKLREANLGKTQSDITKQKRSDSMSRLHWWNNGIENIRAVVCPEGFIAGRIGFKLSASGKVNSSHKGAKWFTNGVENKMVYECPEGFRPGRTKKLNRSGGNGSK